MKINNIAELKTRKGTSNANVEVLGYYTSGDGGGGNFYWDSSSTETDNGGTILSVYSVNTGRWKKVVNKKTISVLEFGAKGDGTTNDSVFIKNAINSNNSVIIFPKPNSYYKVSNLLDFNGLQNKEIILHENTSVLNSNEAIATWFFTLCDNIKITGGKLGYSSVFSTNGGDNQHILRFNQCKYILVDNVNIQNSSEMGIAITSCFDVTVQNCLIEKCLRDGVYCDHSVKVNYLNNRVNNIKDDALSFHDYGLDANKEFIISLGYLQAQDLLAFNNNIEYTFQGIVSIAGKNVKVINNVITNTVGAGISMINSLFYLPGGTALMSDIEVKNNICEKNCKTTVINGTTITNGGQSSTGRASILCASLDANSLIEGITGTKKRNIVISNNTVKESGASGIHLSNINNLVYNDNYILNCTMSYPSSSNSVLEIFNCTNFLEGFNNFILDDRSTALHVNGYFYNNVTGVKGKVKVINNTTSDEGVILNSSLSEVLSILDIENLTTLLSDKASKSNTNKFTQLQQVGNYGNGGVYIDSTQNMGDNKQSIYISNEVGAGLVRIFRINTKLVLGYPNLIVSYAEQSNTVSPESGTYTDFITVTQNGRVSINKSNPNTLFAISGLPIYSDNTSAIAAGLTSGDVYKNSTGDLKITY